MTKFESQALQVIRIIYWKDGGIGNPPSLIPALWNIGILLHEQATRTKLFISSVRDRRKGNQKDLDETNL